MRLRWGLCWLAVCCLLSQVGLFAQSVEGPSALEDSNHIDSASADPSAPVPSTDPQTRTKVSPPAGGNVSNVAPVTVYVFPDKSKIAKYWIRNSFGARAFIGSGLRGTWNT